MDEGKIYCGALTAMMDCWFSRQVPAMIYGKTITRYFGSMFSLLVNGHPPPLFLSGNLLAFYIHFNITQLGTREGPSTGRWDHYCRTGFLQRSPRWIQFGGLPVFFVELIFPPTPPTYNIQFKWYRKSTAQSDLLLNTSDHVGAGH